MEQHRMISATLETVIKRLYQKEDIKSIFVTPYMKFRNPLNAFPMGSSKIRFVLIADSTFRELNTIKRIGYIQITQTIDMMTVITELMLCCFLLTLSSFVICCAIMPAPP
jgi:hypothetical protein